MRPAAAGALVLALVLAACGGRLGRVYEYEEEVFLSLDGSATVVVNTSVAALVALRGAPLNPDPRARFDRAAIRRFYEAPGVEVRRVSRPWRRQGRRFFQVRLQVDDLRHLSRAAPFAWSEYEFRREPTRIVFRQSVRAAADAAAGRVNWTGDELVAFRFHVPSRIQFHNAPSGTTERGNIVVWEQRLADRLRGVPVEVEVQMDTHSILSRTLLLFGGSFAAALLALAALIWWAARSGGRPLQEERP